MILNNVRYTTWKPKLSVSYNQNLVKQEHPSSQTGLSSVV